MIPSWADYRAGRLAELRRQVRAGRPRESVERAFLRAPEGRLRDALASFLWPCNGLHCDCEESS